MKTGWISLAFMLVIAAAVSLAAEDAALHHASWTYNGATGPAHWGELKAAYSACEDGKKQSPIDIRETKAAKLPAIQFDYHATPLNIVNNGHSIQVNYAPGSSISVDGKQYELKQFHFHHPSEERIHGKSFPMVMHLVHADSQGKLAVVAVLWKEGADNGVIGKIWERIPKTAGQEEKVAGTEVNAADLLPSDTSYYTYSGSLTTPPCSEGVTWLVLKTPSAMSRQELDAFGKIYPHNARPVQPLNGRVVRASR